MFFKLIYYLGERFRNPSLKTRLNFLLDSEKWPKSKMDKYQLEKCKEFLIFSYNHSTFYKKYFDDCGFDPNTMESLIEMEKIPPIEKSILVRENISIKSNYSFSKKLQECSTSGSSGISLKFPRNEEWDSGNRAALRRGYKWHGVEPWDRNGYFWGYNFERKKIWKIKLMDFLLNRFRLFSYTDKEINKFAHKLKYAKYIEGYSSMIYEVAKRINQNNISHQWNIQMVKGTSEKIFDYYHAETKQAFGKKIVSEYGAAETGIIAFECEKGSMHVHSEGVVIHTEGNEIIVTNYLSYSFPVIRYRLGDSIKLAPDNFICECGRQHPVIFEVEGRIGKVIQGKNENYPSLTLYYIFKNIALNTGITLKYQGVQEKKGYLTLIIENNSPEYEALVMKECEKYFGNDLICNFIFGQKIHKMQGKLMDFVSKISG